MGYYNVKSMNNMFYNVYFYGDISNWDTSMVNMRYMFSSALNFNPQGDQNINTKIVKYTDSDGNEQQYTAWDTHVY